MAASSYAYEPMGEAHRNAVIDIYNHFIANSMAAYPEEPVPYTMYDRFLDMTRGYPAIVVKDATGRVVGFAFLRPYLAIATFKRSAEITEFILPEYTGRGIGTELLDRLFNAARQMGIIKTVLASVSSENAQSLSFHRKRGFSECGRLRCVGRKHGRDFDVVWMQKDVSE